MKRYVCSVVTLLLNTVGAFLLVFSLQITSTDLVLVSSKDNTSAAFCIGDRAVFGIEGSAMIMGYKCPDRPSRKPAAVINSEHPGMFRWGLILTFVGSLLQVFLLEKPATVVVSPAVSRTQKQKKQR